MFYSPDMSGVDYIIIGAGSAGAIIAARLAEDPATSVLLIEAGGSDRTHLVRKPGMISLVHQVPQLKKKLDWGFKTVPQEHMNDRVIPYTRGKVLGGCSAVNGMLYLRGNKKNYDDWAANGCTGWGYDDVLPFYKKLEDHGPGERDCFGVGGPIEISRHPDDQVSPVSTAFIEAASLVCGIPIQESFNGPEQECASTYQMSCRDGVRGSTAEKYIHPSADRPNFHVQTRALVHRIVIEGGRAKAVSYEQGGKLHTVAVNREVIVSAGTVGSPQLLMLSGIGPADHLRDNNVEVAHDLPGVGKNLHDHLFVPLTFRSPTSLHRGNAPHFFAGMVHEYLVGGGWFGRTVFEGGAFIKSRPEAPIPDIQLHALPWGYPDPNQDEPFPHVDKGLCLSVLPTLIYPKSRGEVLLTSAAADAAPHIDPHFLEAPEDLQLLVTAMRKVREICAAMNGHITEELAPGAERKSDEELAAEVRLRATTVYHPVGTCRMGTDDLAVVDPTLRVRGIEGLRVADASIMPQITGGNTNGPAMMIGERAAALIQET